MSIVNKLHRAIDRVLRIPGIRTIAQWDADRAFRYNRELNLHLGVFQTWKEAEAAAAAWGTAGYDNASSAELYLKWMEIKCSDYAALYWTRKAIESGARRVLDVGGNIGLKYFAFKPELCNWPDVKWLVQDVPAVVERGRQFAVERGEAADGIGFTTLISEGDGYEVLFASGSLQYVPDTLDVLLQSFACPPKYLVVNGTPLHKDWTYYTVNSIGTAFCPYRIQSRAELIDSLVSMGYRLRHSWQDFSRRVEIPHRPQYRVDSYSGLYLERE